MSAADEKEQVRVVRDAKGKRPAFYADPGLDHAMGMIMTLATELCVLRDRLDMHERLALENGIDLGSQIEAFSLDEGALQEREAWRQAFLERLFYLARKEASDAADKASRDSYRQAISDIAET